MQLDAIMRAQALRSTVDLEPISGPGGHIFPPTYAATRETKDDRLKLPGHATERLPDGSLRVLVDSVASQANRQEAALVDARAAGRINFADIYVDLFGTEAAVKELSATEMPHRLSDAILRDSEIDGVPFTKSERFKDIASATIHDLSAVIETSPTTALYGAWFSGFGVPNALRLQRSVVSEIWAENAAEGVTVGGRSDPLGIEAIEIYKRAGADDWTAIETEAERKGTSYVRHRVGKTTVERPADIKHGQIPPSRHAQGITAERITLNWALSLAAIRRLRFGGGEKDAAGRAYLTALGILARALDHEAGYALRSRCDLISKGPLKVDVIDRNGEIETREITSEQAIEMFEAAGEMMQSAGLSINQRIDAKPSANLVGLIAANAEHQRAAEEVAE